MACMRGDFYGGTRLAFNTGGALVERTPHHLMGAHGAPGIVWGNHDIMWFFGLFCGVVLDVFLWCFCGVFVVVVGG